MKILLLDIETKPNKVYTWGLRQQDISIGQIIEPGGMICWAAKWHKRKKMLFRSEYHHSKDEMLTEMWHLLDEADVVVHFNGKKFDIPWINTEFMRLGMPPPSPYRQVDLFRTISGKGRFPSNKLDWLLTEFGFENKVKHEGMQMWIDCIDGKGAVQKRAWAKMRKYCKGDVWRLEELYEYLLPWITQHPNWGVYISPDDPVCRNCGSAHLKRRGFAYTNMRKYQRYRCDDCGSWARGNKCIDKVSNGLTQ